MEFERFIGKTLEDALAQAAQAKGVEKEELHYTVTEEKNGCAPVHGPGRQDGVCCWFG